jgi:hypothetical protein
MFMHRLNRLLLTALSSVVLLNCGHGAAERTINGMPAPSDAVTVSVQNNNWQDVDVYAVRDGQRVRLGHVTATRSGVFVLPRGVALAPDLRIQVHPLAATRDFISSKLTVNPGDIVEIVVGNSLPHTAVIVR